MTAYIAISIFTYIEQCYDKFYIMITLILLSRQYNRISLNKDCSKCDYIDVLASLVSYETAAAQPITSKSVLKKLYTFISIFLADQCQLYNDINNPFYTCIM